MNKKGEQLNIFIEPIINKKKHSLLSYIKVKRLISKLRKTSPDFNMLVEIYKFIILLQKLYMYSPSDKYYLNTIDKKHVNNKADYGFVYQKDNVSIKILLSQDTNHIAIVTDSNNNKNVIEFDDGDAIITNKYEEEAFIYIISCIMDSVCDLIMYYYKHKKF